MPAPVLVPVVVPVVAGAVVVEPVSVEPMVSVCVTVTVVVEPPPQPASASAEVRTTRRRASGRTRRHSPRSGGLLGRTPLTLLGEGARHFLRLLVVELDPLVREQLPAEAPREEEDEHRQHPDQDAVGPDLAE